jgi:hypothetical protein
MTATHESPGGGDGVPVSPIFFQERACITHGFSILFSIPGITITAIKLRMVVLTRCSTPAATTTHVLQIPVSANTTG